VEGAAPDWHNGIPGVDVITSNRNLVRLRVAAGSDPTHLLDIARMHGTISEFAFAPPTLSEVFREAVGQ